MQYIDCYINPITRTVSFPSGTVIVQRDTNVEVLRFHYSLDADYTLEEDSIRIMVSKSGADTVGFTAENARTETNDGGDEEFVFEHTITTYETEDAGQIKVSICGNIVSGDTITEAWHTLNMPFNVSSAVHSDSDEGEESEETIATNAEKIAALQTLVNSVTSGTPTAVSTAAEMTDTDVIYLYTGSESGYQTNYWYYYDTDNSEWVAGAEYGSVTVDTALDSTSGNPVANSAITAELDAINAHLTDIITLDDSALTNAQWSVGVINTTTGVDSSSSTTYRTDYIDISNENSIKISVDSGYKFLAAVINAEKTSVLSLISWTTAEKEIDVTAIEGATYLRILYQTTSYTLPSDFSHISVVRSNSLLEAGKKAIAFVKDPTITFTSGKYYSCVTHVVTDSSDYSYTKIPVALFNGGNISGRTGIVPNSASYGIAFVDANDGFISSEYSTNTGHYEYDYDLIVPDNAAYMYINLRDASQSIWIAPTFPWEVAWSNLQTFSAIKNNVEALERNTKNEIVPTLRNGSVGNSSNQAAVTMQTIYPILHDCDYLMIQFIGDTENSNEYGFAYCLFNGASDGDETSVAYYDSSVTKKNVNSNFDAVPESVPHFVIPITELAGYEHIAVCVFRKNNGTYVPIRVDSEQYCVKLTYGYTVVKTATRGLSNDEALHKTQNARHIKGNVSTPLTILHFSDLHADNTALSRIIADASSFGTAINEKICTGDIVNNSAEQIASWWDSSVLTCIGNHDSASYSDSTYDWTALSMADRDTYYIAPFESNWSITHTSGTSYYYKDYTTQGVRLIVMDAMLYSSYESDTSLATTQTSWLESLLADAITNSLHVLIAIHAPHGGASPVSCSFSKYGATTMPTYSDCNTPQTVIDTVATAIGNGLNFVGYIVGHTHQDMVWDAEGDGTQLMYCVTCANISNANQWKNSDQSRSITEDAYNLITIDTTNTLVKIVRGGGADIDDHMRTRKAICFDYSTGTKVGEVL